MSRILCLVLALCAAGCAVPPADDPAPAPAVVTPVAGHVTDLDAFAAYVATKPTPADFSVRYPDIALVLPGQIATKELRTDNSRYFAELDANGRIAGGRFQ